LDTKVPLCIPFKIPYKVPILHKPDTLWINDKLYAYPKVLTPVENTRHQGTTSDGTSETSEPET